MRSQLLRAKPFRARSKYFTCITCAVGLDTLLRQQKGVLSSKSTYPEGRVTVSYDPGIVTPSEIKAFIGSMGFRVKEQG